jgi:hypothetical protein
MTDDEIKDNPIFAPPVSGEEFEHELEQFDHEDQETNQSDWTLSSRWHDLCMNSDEVNDRLCGEIMAHAVNEHSFHTCLARVLCLGLEIGYRLGSK